MKLRDGCYKLAKWLGDYNAVKRGKVGNHIERRLLGKFAGKLLRGLTR